MWVRILCPPHNAARGRDRVSIAPELSRLRRNWIARRRRHLQSRYANRTARCGLFSPPLATVGRKVPGSVTSVFSEPEDFEPAARADGLLGMLITGRGQFQALLTQIPPPPLPISPPAHHCPPLP